jgi:hypothetical protein
MPAKNHTTWLEYFKLPLTPCMYKAQNQADSTNVDATHESSNN